MKINQILPVLWCLLLFCLQASTGEEATTANDSGDASGGRNAGNWNAGKAPATVNGGGGAFSGRNTGNWNTGVGSATANGGGGALLGGNPSNWNAGGAAATANGGGRAFGGRNAGNWKEGRRWNGEKMNSYRGQGKGKEKDGGIVALKNGDDLQKYGGDYAAAGAGAVAYDNNRGGRVVKRGYNRDYGAAKAAAIGSGGSGAAAAAAGATGGGDSDAAAAAAATDGGGSDAAAAAAAAAGGRSGKKGNVKNISMDRKRTVNEKCDIKDGIKKSDIICLMKTLLRDPSVEQAIGKISGDIAGGAIGLVQQMMKYLSDTVRKITDKLADWNKIVGAVGTTVDTATEEVEEAADYIEEYTDDLEVEETVVLSSVVQKG